MSWIHARASIRLSDKSYPITFGHIQLHVQSHTMQMSDRMLRLRHTCTLQLYLMLVVKEDCNKKPSMCAMLSVTRPLQGPRLSHPDLQTPPAQPFFGPASSSARTTLKSPRSKRSDVAASSHSARIIELQPYLFSNGLFCYPSLYVNQPYRTAFQPINCSRSYLSDTGCHSSNQKF